MKRIDSIDFTRGVVMMIMALDHVRDLMHVSAGSQSPTDLSTTTPGLFFTRWITYLCAPIFVFLAGTSAYLSVKSKGNVVGSSTFLLKRGLWLVFLELTIVNFGLFFDPGFHTVLFEVIAAIGFGFILLSLALKLPPRLVGLIGLAILLGHDLFSFIPFSQGSAAVTFITPFFSMAAFPLSAGHFFIVAYPPIPWLGVIMTGYGAGRLFEWPALRRKKVFFQVGLVLLLFFVLLRFSNLYGDPVEWSTQKSSLFTFLSFINVNKYPPSLLFCLVTLGIMFLVLGFAEMRQTTATSPAMVYGKVPLFYFVVHFYLVHILLVLLLFLQGFHWNELEFSAGTFGRPKGRLSGVSLWAVYAIWVGVVAILYKPCAWYGRYKATHSYWWLRYT